MKKIVINLDEDIQIGEITIRIEIPENITESYEQISYAMDVADSIPKLSEIGFIIAEIGGEGLIKTTGRIDSWWIFDDFEHRVQCHDGWSFDN